MIESEHDDTDLAQRIAGGDEAALASFYQRYADVLFAFIYQHMPEARTDAEEIWQDALMATLRAMPRYRGDAALFTWMCSIARHKINDYFRRRPRRRRSIAFSDLPEGWPEHLSGSGPLPEELLAERALRVRVVEALGTLAEDYRNALVARYVDEHPVPEVARRLGRSYKATESLLSRARNALREALMHLENKR